MKIENSREKSISIIICLRLRNFISILGIHLLRENQSASEMLEIRKLKRCECRIYKMWI
jgi:hypothetical protein